MSTHRRGCWPAERHISCSILLPELLVLELCIDRRPQPVSAPPTGRLLGPAVIDLSVHVESESFGVAAVQFGRHGLRGLWVSTGVVPVSPAALHAAAGIMPAPCIGAVESCCDTATQAPVNACLFIRRLCFTGRTRRRANLTEGRFRMSRALSNGSRSDA